MKNLLIVVFNALILASSITPSYSASFDCSKAKSKPEKLICSNQSLSNLDEDLNKAYQEQLTTIKNTGMNPTALIEDQRAWVKLIRNTCENLNCLLNVYPERIKDIQNFSAMDHISVTESSDDTDAPENDALTLYCDYQDGNPSKESAHITQQPVDEKDLSYVDSFKRGDKKAQHMRFDVSSGSSASCEFPSGKSVKVKVGEGVSSGYGECGADPEIFASIWIDQKKVISRRWFAGHCVEIFDQPLFSLNISNDKVSACNTTRSKYSKGKVTKPTASCTPINDIQKLPLDTIEYPLPGTKPSPVGSMEIINGKSPLCQSISSTSDIYRVFDAYTGYQQAEASIELPEGFEGSTESVYDFNNDGKLDRVFTKQLESHYMQGSALIIQFGKSQNKIEVSKGPLLSENSMIAACQLGSIKYPIEECPPLSGQKADDSGFEMAGRPGEPPIYFRARYLYLKPFRYKNSNYVGVNSYSEDTMNYIAIIKPLPNREFEQTCLVRQVPENY